MEKYIQLVISALKNIGPEYFKLATTYEPSGIVRERVFCYELYHLIRCQMSPDDPISLNGEIDKRGHFDFDASDRKNPDFIFHIPGTHIGNTIVMEVKGTLNFPPAEIEDDLNTILTFILKYGYSGGIFLLYNHTLGELSAHLGHRIGGLRNNPMAHLVTLLSLQKAKSDPERAILAEL